MSIHMESNIDSTIFFYRDSNLTESLTDLVEYNPTNRGYKYFVNKTFVDNLEGDENLLENLYARKLLRDQLEFPTGTYNLNPRFRYDRINAKLLIEGRSPHNKTRLNSSANSSQYHGNDRRLETHLFARHAQLQKHR